MPYYAQMIVPNSTNIDPTPSGVEFPNQISRRLIDFVDYYVGRLQYMSDQTADLAVKLEYSSDDGTTWNELIPTGPTVISKQPVTGVWQFFPSEVTELGEVLTRAVAVGSAGSKQIWYVEFQYK